MSNQTVIELTIVSEVLENNRCGAESLISKMSLRELDNFYTVLDDIADMVNDEQNRRTD